MSEFDVLHATQLEIMERQDRIEAKLDAVLNGKLTGPAWYSLETYAERLGSPKGTVKNNAYMQPTRKEGPNSRLIFWWKDVELYCTLTETQMRALHGKRLIENRRRPA